MSTSFKNVTPTGPGGTATLLIVLSFTGFLLLTQSLFVVPSGQVAVVTTGYPVKTRQVTDTAVGEVELHMLRPQYLELSL